MDTTQTNTTPVEDTGTVAAEVVDVVVEAATAETTETAETEKEVQATQPETVAESEEIAGDELVDALLDTGFTQEHVSQFEADLLANGDLSEASYALLAEKNLDGLARAYIKALAELTETASKQAVVDHFQEIEQYNTRVADSNDRIISELGGIEVVDQLIAFKNSLSAKEIKAFDEAAEQLGDVALKAFKELQQTYELKHGSIDVASTPQSTPHAQPSGGDVFASDAEYRQALRDKRYGRDAEYSRQVRTKLENSILRGIIPL